MGCVNPSRAPRLLENVVNYSKTNYYQQGPFKKLYSKKNLH